MNTESVNESSNTCSCGEGEACWLPLCKGTPRQIERKRKAKKHDSESETERKRDESRLLKQLQWEANGGP